MSNQPKQNKPFIAVPLMMSGAFMIVLQNTFAKLLGENGLTPIEIVFYRNLGGLLLISGLIFMLGKTARFKTTRPKMQLTRAIIGNICIGLVFWANTLLPLATVTAILLSSHIAATALSPILLKEKLSWYRWSCVIAGFIGAIIITQPGTLDFNKDYIVAIMAAIAMAGVTLSLGALSDEDSLTTNFYFFGIGIIITGPITLYIANDLPSAPLVLAGVIAAGFLNQTLRTHAYRYGNVSLLSPIQYFNIVWATLLGWAIWNEIPQAHVYIGCSIIIISNILITWREHHLAKLDT